MTWISGIVVERQDKDELSEIVVEALGSRYAITIQTADADREGYKVGVGASVDVTINSITVMAIARHPK